MDNYFDSYKEMISLRNLSDHTLKSYSTYIRAYLDYLTGLGICPSNASWDDMRSFIKQLQMDRNLADRTVNCAISQLRFLTLYVLHKPWDNTQLPLRRFDEFLPYVPSKEEVLVFIDSMPNMMVSMLPAVKKALPKAIFLKAGLVSPIDYYNSKHSLKLG